MKWLHAIPRTRGMSSAEAAAHWVVRRDARKLTATEEAEFAEWHADPLNASAYRKANGAMTLFDAAHRSDPNLRALRQAAREAVPASRLRPGFGTGALIAASLVGAITMVGIRPAAISPARPTGTVAVSASAPDAAPEAALARVVPTAYSSGVGERRTIRLPDGTAVTLNTRTRLTIAFTDAHRLVRLLHGQALFDVAHDSNRPFTVEAADRQITALGTMFEVRVEPGLVNVVLVSGRVVIDQTREAASASDSIPLASTILKPSERFSAELGAPQRITTVDVNRQLLWREGFVEFDDQPLGVAVAEINRYASRPVILDDDGVASLHISGLFRTGAPDRFVDAVGAILPVETKPTPEGGIKISLAARTKR